MVYCEASQLTPLHFLILHIIGTCHWLLSVTNFLKPQVKEDSSHSPVPDSCLASDLEFPELPRAGATPEVTAKLLVVYSSKDFLPASHATNHAHGFVIN